MKHIFSFCFTLFLLNVSLFAQTKPDDILGIWLTHGKKPAKIQIFKSGNKYFGKIMWLQIPEENGQPMLDKNNPDEKLHSRQIMGLVILNGFAFNGSDEWDDGKIYDPDSGKTYNCYLSLKDKTTLKVRGYIGISLVGRTEYWTKSLL